MDHIKNTVRKAHPRDRANFLSNIFFGFALNTYIKGFKKDLNEGDLYAVLKDYKSKDLGDQLEEQWIKQKKRQKNMSITRLLLAEYGLPYLFIGFLQLIMDTAVVIVRPYAIQKLVSFFRPGNDMTRQDAYFWAIILISFNYIHIVYKHNFFLVGLSFGIKIRTAFCSFIYRKALKLSPAHVGNISIGKIVTLITKDANTFESFVDFGNELWIGLFKTVIVSILLYIKIGIAALAGVAVFLLVIPLQFYLGSRATSLKMKMCKTTDERIQMTQETLSAMRIIKMYTWEKVFFKKISDSRKEEMRRTFKISCLKFCVLVIGNLTGHVAFYVMLMTYISLGNSITAGVVYYIMSCFDTLSHGLSILFPLGVYQMAELKAAIKRVGNVLKTMEVEVDEQPTNITILPKISLKNVTVSIDKKKILHRIDLTIGKGLTIITGSVGSGKSFLLKTILQDYKPEEGGVIVQGRISYASQEPWLFPSSIRQNILFGAEFDEKRYHEVLKVCALIYDLELLENGDNTIVEDRGINLSKGQQARISLARAVYKDSEIYLLDDCLSALDAHVSSYIFKECVKGFLGDKLVILVTHNTKHLIDSDNAIVMSHGTISVGAKPEYSENEINDNQTKKLLEAAIDDKEEDEEASEDTKLVTEPPTSKKVYQEEKQEGEVDFGVYKTYISSGGGLIAFFSVFLIFASAQFCVSYTDKLISSWVNLEQEIYNTSLLNDTNSTTYDGQIAKRSDVFYIYTLMIFATGATFLGKAFFLHLFAKKASIQIHKLVIKKIIYATMHFFDTTFIGNILNRFSKDLNTVDEKIPDVFYHVFRVFFYLIGVVILISTVNKFFLIPTVIFLTILVILRRCALRTGRSLKRLDASTRSPVVGHLNATLEGLTTIRAFNAEMILKNEFDRHQDLNTSAYYTLMSSMRAFAYAIDSLCAGFIGIIVVQTLMVDNVLLAGSVGLAISQAFKLTGTLQWGIRQWTEVENQMTSVERVLEYTKIKQESKQGLEVENWPTKGEIKYENVSLSYASSDDYVLKNISFVVNSREKVGVVGRTGAGKSSIIASLFRLYEVDGKITIDGVDTKTISLEFLRTHLSIIPQDPVLFTGTIRDNIDPTRKYTDSEIWHAIEAANLKKIVPSLDLEITDGGSSYSVGQRQLICLARAIARNNRIIILDEATANMDQETDNLIQETIKKNFESCSVFTIAHKLSTIMHSDKIMVLEKGAIIEFDHPDVLLQNQNGDFYKMVQKAGLLTNS